MKFAEIRIRRNVIQATRYEPAREIVSYDVRIPDGSPCEWMSCKTIEQAREFAARYGYALEGDADQTTIHT